MIYRPAEHEYNYVGTDISLQRLILAKQVIPEGEFVQCSALNLPFQTDTFDLVFSFGMLHHIPDQSAALYQVFSKLRQKGEFLVHEPVKKPKNILTGSGGIYQMVKHLMTKYTHSDHDGELNTKETLQNIDRLKGRIVYKHFTGSVVRTIGARLLVISPWLHAQKWIWRFLIAVDHFFVRAFCRTPNRLGPNAVFMIIKKQ
jgi:SAM-dependent methyltransferase